MNTILAKALWTIWTVVSLLLFATLTTDLEITRGFVTKGLIYVFIVGLTAIVTLKKPWSSIKILTVAAMMFGLYLLLTTFLDWRGDWKTQTILYRNNHSSNRTIEFQLQDKGIFGYNRRTVDRLKLFPFVSWTKGLSDESLETIDSLT